MRVVLIAAISLFLGSALDTARADPYPWCALLNMGDASYNCYFSTLQQCQATVSGVGGMCLPNQFYDGRPLSSPSRRPS